ncbi:hypothetical protein Dimus_002690 [Dionaea muscipula]
MATYYPTSTAQIDVLSAPYVRDQKFASYSELPLHHGNMMMYLNPAGSFSEISSASPPIPASEIPSMAGGRNEIMMFIPPNGGPMSMQTINGRTLNTATTTDTVGSSHVPRELPLTTSRSQLGMVEGEQNLQGLSLSLNSTQMSTAVQQHNSQFQYPPYANPGVGVGLTSFLSSSSHLPLPAENGCGPVTAAKVVVDEESSHSKDLRSSGYVPYDDDIHGVGEGENYIRFGTPNGLQYPTNPQVVNCNSYQYEQAGIANTILKSKYLKAAQQLLDEVVNVGVVFKQPHSGKDQNIMNKTEEEGSKDYSKGKTLPASDAAEESATGSSQELSAAERQDLQNKLDKLLAMLDEVDRRYKQYYHQMQILVSSFDIVAGIGAAKPYTALALKTISRHFRCLHDAIGSQIQITRKSLGEHDASNGQGGGSIPRLRYIDQQLRQQRALQQFGMMRHAWRPQRGLPESAVSILRAWLFEHFLHPYPKDSEKLMLARQTGLTRGQVANWFINARVRLWKPMVEEMYKEEFGDHSDINFKSSPVNTPKRVSEDKAGDNHDHDHDHDLQESETSLPTDDHLQRHGGNHDHGVAMSWTTGRGGLQFNPHGDDAKNYGFMKLPNDNNNNNNNSEGSFIAAAAAAYQVQELSGFTVDNQVSLALGLRNGTTTTEAAVDTSTTEYHPYLDPVNPQHRFSNLHLLNDFVT